MIWANKFCRNAPDKTIPAEETLFPELLVRLVVDDYFPRPFLVVERVENFIQSGVALFFVEELYELLQGDVLSLALVAEIIHTKIRF